MTPGIFLRFKDRLIRSVALAGLAVAFLSSPLPAGAEIFRVSGSIPTLQPGGTWRGVETAYDPVNDVYLVVAAYGDVRGVFTNGDGSPITEVFTIHTGSFGHFPNAEYSPHVSNGAGGSGGFLVIWNDGAHGNSIQGRVVAVHAPGRLVTGVQLLSDPGHGSVFFENRPVVAYSPSSGRFLVVWSTGVPSFGMQGRRVDTNGTPVGGVLRFEEGGSRDPAVIWNRATDEFGVGNTGWGGGGAFASFRLVRAADGLVHSRTTFGFGGGTYATGLDLNLAYEYVFTWGLHPGTTSAVFNHNGVLLGTNFVSSRIGGDLSMGLAFNPTTGTFLVVSSDWFTVDVAAAELAANGAPMTSAAPITAESRASYYPLPAARTGTNQWNVVYSPNYLGATNQIVASNGLGAVSAPVPSGGGSSSGCSTADPFASIGGGTCVNGGWLPGGGGNTTPLPAPAPAPSAGCATSDPFASLGGGICVNGGWLPPGSAVPAGASPAPPPPPAPSSCASAQPGAGWVCVGDGWLPPGHPGAAGVVSSGGSSGGCTTADPFASIGGGTCSGGGWLPGPNSSCGTPDPFASLGGGVCVGGGWTPTGM